VRFVSFYDDAANVRPGFIENGALHPIACTSLIEYIAAAPSERQTYHVDKTLDAAKVRLAAPVRPRKNVFCVGRNYMEHAKEGARALGRELKLPEVPTFFTKAPTAIADPDATLTFSAKLSEEYDWEAELAVVIGQRTRDCPEERALDAVFGYTALNDLTARNLQRAHGQWFKGKSLDESCPLGPWIVPISELGDGAGLGLSLCVNGIEKQHARTDGMIFPVRRLIAELSAGLTLEPGDVIATGTPEGVGFARTPPEFLHDGDVVEVSIDRIGTLRNTIRIERVP